MRVRIFDFLINHYAKRSSPNAVLEPVYVEMRFGLGVAARKVNYARTLLVTLRDGSQTTHSRF